jgi:NAD(P)-dependent dehydrogenase (short-subunit alcohol dehydrogenase family)
MGEMMQELSQQHVVVIGGSSGIGLEVAQQALQKGAFVTIVARSPERLNRIQQLWPDLKTLPGDLADEQRITEIFAAMDVVDHVYIAAGSTHLGSILDGPVQPFRQAFDERIWGSVFAVRAAVKKMRLGGSFCFTGGVSTARPVLGAWVSGIATAAAEQLARVLALELPDYRFNAVSPGWTDTPMWDRFFGTDKAAVLDSMAAKLLTRRLATAAEVAQAVLFLMANRAVTGEVVHVDSGGRLV